MIIPESLHDVEYISGQSYQTGTYGIWRSTSLNVSNDTLFGIYEKVEDEDEDILVPETIEVIVFGRYIKTEKL